MKRSRSQRLRKTALYAVALVMLGGGGLLLNEGAVALAAQQRELGLQAPPVAISRRDALSQQLAFFTLGGMRSLVAEVLALDATDAWSKRDWPRNRRRWESITAMAPRRLNYWLSAAYDMRSNAAGDVAQDASRPRAERHAAAREYIDYAEQFLLKGAAQNPQSWQMYTGLADHYGDIYRHPQFSKAAAALRRALVLGAPREYERPLFYHLCRIRGAEQEAWALGRALWEDAENRVPAVRFLLFVLQNKISVPADEALSAEALYRRSPEQSEQELQQRIRKDFLRFLDNDLLYPVNGVREYLNRTPSGAREEKLQPHEFRVNIQQGCGFPVCDAQDVAQNDH